MLLSGEAGSKVERVGVGRRGCGGSGKAEEELPETGVNEGLAGAVGELTEEGEGFGIVGVDDAVAEVADEDVTTEDAEGGRSNGDSPGCVEVAAGTRRRGRRSCR